MGIACNYCFSDTTTTSEILVETIAEKSYKRKGLNKDPMSCIIRIQRF